MQNFRGVIWGGIQWDELTERRLRNSKCLERYGYKVYSQNDEDGMIQEIFRRIGTTNRIFLEFGVQDGLESNGHYLLHCGWKGIWLESRKEYYEVIKEKFKPVIHSGKLQVYHTFVTKDNINTIITEKVKRKGRIDFLSIDIDGNDYYIWEAIHVIEPRVVCIEYNGKFPPDYEWKQAYQSEHVWDGSDWHGASLKALELLGKRLGYTLVGTNLNGVNAFFVKTEEINGQFYEVTTAEELYNPLRLELYHRSGHPAKWCLVDQEEELGIFNYIDKNMYPLYGFYEEERWNDEVYRWISNTNSRILIHSKKYVECNTIDVVYKQGIPQDRYKKHFIVKMQLNDHPQLKYEIVGQEGILSFEILPEDRRKKIWVLDIHISHLWIPQKVLGTDDGRNLGIAISFS